MRKSTEVNPSSGIKTNAEIAKCGKNDIANECIAIFANGRYERNRRNDYGGEVVTLATSTPWITKSDGTGIQITQIQSRNERRILDVLLRSPETYQEPHKFEISTDPTSPTPYCTVWVKDEGAVTHFKEALSVEDGGEIERDRKLLTTIKQVHAALQIGELTLPPSTHDLQT